MRNVVVAILFIASAVIAELTTKYRTDLDLVTGKSFVQEYSSTFEIMNDRFVHSAEDITSVYVVIGDVKTYSIGGNEITAVPCRSEAGNEYIYIFDVKNQRVYTIFSNGSRLVQFDLIGQ
jgi:hypothetical protein